MNLNGKMCLQTVPMVMVHFAGVEVVHREVAHIAPGEVVHRGAVALVQAEVAGFHLNMIQSPLDHFVVIRK